MLKTNLLIQSAGILPAPAMMVKKLGLKTNYGKLSPRKQVKLKSNYLTTIGIKQFLDDRGLLEDENRNEDVVIYFGGFEPSGLGNYKLVFYKLLKTT